MEHGSKRVNPYLDCPTNDKIKVSWYSVSVPLTLRDHIPKNT